jgi:protein-S-isoprenylcysteine O-methyltransferase Ste14
MSRWGAGPLFALLSLVIAVPVIMIARRLKPLFEMSFLPHRMLAAAGVALIVVGIFIWLSAVISVQHAYTKGKLITSGVYGLCRHPLYAAWAFFIATGIAFLLNSWLCLVIPVILCAALKRLAKKEDIYLETRFGAEYINYKQRTPAVLPFGWIKTLLK